MARKQDPGETDTLSVRLCRVIQYYNTHQKAVSNTFTFITHLKKEALGEDFPLPMLTQGLAIMILSDLLVLQMAEESRPF